jgi:hypothetical protein
MFVAQQLMAFFISKQGHAKAGYLLPGTYKIKSF